MKISKILESIAKSKSGQKFYKWCTEPKSEKFLNNTIPQVETVLSTTAYCIATARQKDIDEDRRKLLQIQNVGSGAAGIVIATALNKKVGKFSEEVIKNLDTKKIDPKSIRQISTGIRVGGPILITATVMRFVTPTVLALVSGKMMDKDRENRKNKLDVKA